MADMTIPTTPYSSYTDNYSSQSAKELESKLSTTNLSTASDEELMEACKSFESYFLEQVFKAMEKTVMKDEESGNSDASKYVDYFKDMQTQKYAEMASENSNLGLAQMLFEQLKLNVAGTIPAAAETDTAEQTTE